MWLQQVSKDQNRIIAKDRGFAFCSKKAANKSKNGEKLGER
jgi:hypothetical protein